MAKTTRDDRRQRGKRQREPKEFDENVLQIARVTRVVKGGRRMRFRAAVVVGNRKGKVGIGIGKGSEVQGAIQKAVAQARRRMIRVPITGDTIPHEVDLKFKAARIRLIPASKGTGIIAGGALRPILELAGVRNVLSKRYGTTNPVVNAQATMMALARLRSREGTQPSVPAEEEAGVEGLDIAAGAEADAEVLEGIDVEESEKGEVQM